MGTIVNPILRGFNPDPSIVRVDTDYYIATSTFEWFPGVQIHHSNDLLHWRLLTHPLTRVSQLDLRGNPSSGGVWAPCLSYHNGLFYLVYTDVKHWQGGFKDTHNYLVTAPDIMGPWSDPIYLNSSGFDPSLFHDDDGRVWLVNMVQDFRRNRREHKGIVLQEYAPAEQRLVGPATMIFAGTPLGDTEGPHLYKRHGYYYLLTAEGGTGYGHAVTMARSRSLQGPYEVDPYNPILTSANQPDLALQKAGHASVVQTQTDEWYMVHLCGRPLRPQQRCPLGRETAIQRCVWTDDGWLRLEGGGRAPRVLVPGPALPAHPWPAEPARDDFDASTLSVHFNTLRVPAEESWLSLTERPGYLRLRGRESLHSWHRQSLVARRLQAFHSTVETCVEFEPEHFQQMAGLICFYDTHNYVYLRISHDEELGKCLGILRCDRGEDDEPPGKDVPIPGRQPCYLRASIHEADLQFFYSSDGRDWSPIGPIFDASRLSDEYCRQTSWFTGTFVGMCVQDLSGARKHADFDYFVYREECP